MLSGARRRQIRGHAWIALVVAPVVLAAAVWPQEAEPQRWKGVMELPGVQMEFSVAFTEQADGEYGATIDIPAQGVTGLALSDIVYTAAEISFTIAQAPPSGAVFTAAVAEDGKSAQGQIEQGGLKFPISLEKLEPGEDLAGPPRPQTPQPPFPYEARDVAYTNSSDATVLAGTLTVPMGAGPHPAAIMITGSGAQDRDETIFSHKPFFVIADHLSRNGVAVLRVDDRGMGGSSGSMAEATSEVFAGDVLAGVDFLMQQPGVDHDRIGLIGHSEGGIVAPLVAARSDEVAFIVMLAGTALSGAEIMPLQLELVQLAIGRPEENVRRQLEAQKKLIDRVLEGADRASVREAVHELTEIQLSTVPEGQAPDEATLEAMIDAETARMLAPWWHFFLSYDPRQALRQVSCPVLALNGSLDLQVPADANLQEIERTLTEAGNADVTVVELPGLNHLFQTATTGSPTEYGVIEETFAPEALELMTEWIRERTGLAEGR